MQDTLRRSCPCWGHIPNEDRAQTGFTLSARDISVRAATHWMTDCFTEVAFLPLWYSRPGASVEG